MAKIPRKDKIMNHLQNLFELYDHPNRYYHNFNHIVEMWRVLAKHTKITPQLYTAVLYHDAIYNPKYDDNEFQSALLYELHCDDMFRYSTDDTLDSKVVQMILDTKEHIPTIDESELLIDADLWILGSNIWTYREYKEAIKKEYEPFFTETEMIAGRTAFLENMLDRKNIFYTPEFQRCYTHNAKINLETELIILQDLKVDSDKETSDWEPITTPDLRRPTYKGTIKEN